MVAAEVEGLEVRKSLELEIAVGDEAEAYSRCKVNAAAAVHPRTSCHQMGLEFKDTGKMKIPISTGQGAVHR